MFGFVVFGSYVFEEGVVFGPIIMCLLFLLTYAAIRFLSCGVGVGMGTTTTPAVTGRGWRLHEE